MSQIEKINIPDPHNAVSSRVISEIVSSPEQWASWNVALEQALNRSPDTVVIENIRATAAVYAHTQSSLDTTHQGRHTLALYRAVHSRQYNNQTMGFSIQDVATGFWRGISDWVEKKTTPGDMNLEHSQNRGDPMRALLDLPKALPQQAEKSVEVIGRIADEPSLVTKAGKLALENTSRLIATKSKEMLLTAVAAPNPAEASGEMMGVTAAVAATELAMNINPLARASKAVDVVDGAIDAVQNASKIDMHALGKLMGEGSYPPKPKDLRDFSDQLLEDFSTRSGVHSLVHKFSEQTFINMSVVNDTMSFVYKRMDNNPDLPTGTEMGLSAMEAMHLNGVNIKRVKAQWAPDVMNSNHSAFWENIDNGMTVSAAIKDTPTGKLLARVGLTNVEVTPKLLYAVANNDRRETLLPMLRGPDWGHSDTPAWGDYANAWQSSMGRRSIELIKDGVGDETDHMQKLTHPVDVDRDDAISHGLNGDDLSP